MIDVKDLRTIKVLQEGKWIKIRSIGQLEEGDVFQMWEPDGEPVKNNKGGVCFMAKENPGIDCEALP